MNSLRKKVNYTLYFSYLNIKIMTKIMEVTNRNNDNINFDYIANFLISILFITKILIW